MKRIRDLIGICRLPSYFFQKGFSPDFDDSSHVVPVESMHDFIFFAGSLERKFYFLAKMISFGRISLFDYDFDDIFSFEDLVRDNRDIDNANLCVL